MRSTWPLLSLFASAAIAGCAPVPRLAVAPAVLSRDWGTNGDTATSGNTIMSGGTAAAGNAVMIVPREQFWHAFGSPDLDRLIAAALANNPGLDAARARVDRARAELRVTRSTRLPTVNATLSGETGRNAAQGAPIYTYNGISAGLDISYDLDLFGANAASRRAGRARLVGVGFDADAAALVLQAEVAKAYVQFAALNDRIALADQKLAGGRDLQRIIAIRIREGAADDGEAARQTVEVERIVAFRTTLAEQRRHILTALALLVGAEAPRFAAPPARLAGLSRPGVDPEQPAMVVVRRPDIRAAEARISAARGDVDAARRAFLPSLKLTTSGFGTAVSLLGPIGLTTNAGASLLAPIFQGGRLRGQLEAASASQRESVALYRQTLLSALGEVTDALSSTELTAEREASAKRALTAAQRDTRLNELRYREGDIELKALIDARWNQYEAEDLWLTAAQDRLIAAIDVFRATGGAPASDGNRAG